MAPQEVWVLSPGEGGLEADAWGLGSGVWEPLLGGYPGDACAAPVDFPVLSEATWALPIHKTAKASSLGVHGRWPRWGQLGRRERNVLLFQV